MRILFFGDIVGRNGRQVVKRHLNELIEKYRIDFVIANGENATHGKGLIEKHYHELIDAGIDAITLGNHYATKSDIRRYINEAECLVRPLNILKPLGGSGSVVFDVDGTKIRVTNLLGTAFMKEEVNHPYFALKDLLAETLDDEIHIVDFHGEATAEKIAFAFAFDGQVSAILGTHTHVQTRDYRLLPNKTAFISDVGMCGAYNGVIGFKKEEVINRTLFGKDDIFQLDEGDQSLLSAVVLDIDNNTKKAQEIFPIYILENGRNDA
ncbi:MAG: TIGR00282 family metallophosphoesterase [Bacilli bacterium]|jgi:metallophosphoesterase (TIGR00282 family)|nr:TIGR00282 family metallophosphoesterase [Bacilli bacterium]HOC80650.1 TIGR00282 family metallophosphoesterase [Bacilli bacterium]